jgi:hypothetical protein
MLFRCRLLLRPRETDGGIDDQERGQTGHCWPRHWPCDEGPMYCDSPCSDDDERGDLLWQHNVLVGMSGQRREEWMQQIPSLLAPVRKWWGRSKLSQTPSTLIAGPCR